MEPQPAPTNRAIGLLLTADAVRRQIEAMPSPFYRIRLIDSQTRLAMPGRREWSGEQLCAIRILSFLRAANGAGHEVYFQPCGFTHNAGYILVDLDAAGPGVIQRMRVAGHQPCVVVETSPGRLQAWVRVSEQVLAPAVATEVARQLARLYQGDPASAGWLHMGRLAGFANRKPQRQLWPGAPPWVRLRQAQRQTAAGGAALVEAASSRIAAAPQYSWLVEPPGPQAPPSATLHARSVYQAWLEHLRIRERFPQPDWSVVDLWIARRALAQGLAVEQVRSVLEAGSPGFPRGHVDPGGYLRRTLERAACDLAEGRISARAAKR